MYLRTEGANQRFPETTTLRTEKERKRKKESCTYLTYKGFG